MRTSAIHLLFNDHLCAKQFAGNSVHGPVLYIAVPNLFGTRDRFHGIQFFPRPGEGGLGITQVHYWRRQWHPTPGSCLENPMDGGAWWAAVCGVAQSRTRLKRLSSSSSKCITFFVHFVSIVIA